MEPVKVTGYKLGATPGFGRVASPERCQVCGGWVEPTAEAGKAQQEVYLLVFGAEEGQGNVVKIYSDIGDAEVEQRHSTGRGLVTRLFRGHSLHRAHDDQ